MLLLSGAALCCRWPSLTDYTDLANIYKEWEEGIVYATMRQQTVPMKELEKDKAEGRQEHAWRGAGLSRTAISDRKMVIYTALNAKHIDGLAPETFLANVQAQANDELAELPRGRGPKPKMFTMARTVLASSYSQYLVTKAVPFEESMLGWKISSALAAQAKSRASA